MLWRVDGAALLAGIQATALHECGFDTDKRVDVAPGTTPVAREGAGARIETDFSHLRVTPSA
ncbi:hypothetical protein [Acidovorax sp. JHL-9]|uniref:hypothetical protein n=1 Tax=Acidovorax sp. JHL-9 TaxID=1276756 RepID=UPI0004210D0F|nr:hypothetical protein [Acidovorax sp. JHL-9]